MIEHFPVSEDTLTAFAQLVEVVHELRVKCPWDREQTNESLRHLTIEETYELADAILAKDVQETKVELGDLLLHIIFYARIAEEKGDFDLKKVFDSLKEKLIRRHPHIYGTTDLQLDNADAVRDNWEKIKQLEGKKKKSALAGVPDSLPTLIKAMRMQEKAASIGFDWADKTGAWEKLQEEIGEFEAETSLEKQTDEMGDIFFALINYCRLSGINADEALARTNQKFKSRFQYMEKKAETENTSLTVMTLDEMEAWWQEAKSVKSE